MTFSSSVPEALLRNSSITELQLPSKGPCLRENAVKTMVAILDGIFSRPLPFLCQSQKPKVPVFQKEVQEVDQKIQAIKEKDFWSCCQRVLPVFVLQQIEKISKDMTTKVRMAKIWIHRNENHEIFQKEGLDLSEAGLKSVPLEFLGKFRCLIRLILAKNELTALPNEFCLQLSRLQELSLSWNLLITLPHTIGKMEQMRRLFIHCNKLEKLPEEMERMRNLTKLGLWRNRISTFPLSLTRLRNLNELDLTENLIREIPDGVGSFHSMKALGLEGNPISWFSEEVIAKLVDEAKCTLWIDNFGATIQAFVFMVQRHNVRKSIFSVASQNSVESVALLLHTSSGLDNEESKEKKSPFDHEMRM